MKIDKRKKMWLDGHSCLSPKCDPAKHGFYNGYAYEISTHKSVAVCKSCGDIQSASMRTYQFLNKVRQRDEDPNWNRLFLRYIKEFNQ